MKMIQKVEGLLCEFRFLLALRVAFFLLSLNCHMLFPFDIADILLCRDFFP